MLGSRSNLKVTKPGLTEEPKTEITLRLLILKDDLVSQKGFSFQPGIAVCLANANKQTI